ncbi:MAG: cell division ATPase MinD [archaeon]
MVHYQNKPVCLMRKPAPKELLTLCSANGDVSITPEHQFVIMRSGKMKKVRADEIIPKKDYLLAYKSAHDIENDESVPIHIAIWLGYLIGDGTIRKEKVSICSGPGNMTTNIRDSFMKVFGECFESKRKNVYYFQFFKRQRIRELFEKYGVKKALAGEKEVPTALFKSNNPSIAAFIRGLFDTDGTVNIDRREVEFDTKSKKLAFQVASLLRNRFAISSQITLTHKMATNGKMTEKQPYWRLYITGNNARRYSDYIGFTHEEKANRLFDQLQSPTDENTNIDVYPIGKLLKQIREESGLTGLQIGKKLGCTKQMVYEYEWDYYAPSKETVRRYLNVYKEMKIDHPLLSWLEQMLQGNIEFRRVDEIKRIQYPHPYVYDFQVTENGGHFEHASGIILSNTSICANLGIALAQRGVSVCLVDADIAMANLSLMLGMQSSPITLHDVLLGEAGVQDALYDGPAGLKLIPSGLSLENYRRVDADRLASVIKSIQHKFDFVILDGPAGIEKSVLASIAATEECLLIATPDSPSIADVLKTKIVSQRLGSKPIGIVLNMVRFEKGEIGKDEVSRMLELPVYATVPFDDEMRHSFVKDKAMPVMLRNPQARSSIEIQKLAARLAGLPVQMDDHKQSSGIMAAMMGFFARLFGGGKGKSGKGVEEMRV